MHRVFAACVCVGVLVAGCGGSEAPIDTDDFASPIDALSSITLSPTASSLTIADAEVFYDDSSDVVVTTVGEVCAAATDRSACVSDHDRLLATDPGGWPVVAQCVMCGSEPARLMVATGPDGARVVVGQDAADVLAPIDRDIEVALVFGQSVRLQRVDDGWRFVHSLIVETCDPVTERTTLYSMSSTGAVAELDFSESSENGVCI